jgi:hypothetical protein
MKTAKLRFKLIKDAFLFFAEAVCAKIVHWVFLTLIRIDENARSQFVKFVACLCLGPVSKLRVLLCKSLHRLDQDKLLRLKILYF